MPVPPAPAWIVALLVASVCAYPASAQLALHDRPSHKGASMMLRQAESSMRFAPRSLDAAGPWELCPRPFFGGECMTVEGSKPQFNLPRRFSGTVASARPVPVGKNAPAGVAKPAADKAARPAADGAARPAADGAAGRDRPDDQ